VQTTLAFLWRKRKNVRASNPQAAFLISLSVCFINLHHLGEGAVCEPTLAKLNHDFIMIFRPKCCSIFSAKVALIGAKLAPPAAICKVAVESIMSKTCDFCLNVIWCCFSLSGQVVQSRGNEPTPSPPTINNYSLSQMAGNLLKKKSSC
jgi:hypothetical protein